MNFLKNNLIRYWLSPIIIASVIFAIVQPGFADAFQASSTLASYLSAGNSVSVGLATISESGFQQVFYDYQGMQYVVTNDNRWKREVQSEGEYIVWQTEMTNGWQIFLYNILLDQEVKISSTQNNLQPRIDASGPYVVWRGWVNDRWQVFLYDGISTRQVTQGDVSWNVDIKDGVVVFNQQDDAGARWAVQYDILADSSNIIANGRLAMSPYFKADGAVGYRTEDDDIALQQYLALLGDDDNEDGNSEPHTLRQPETIEEMLAYYDLSCPAITRAVCGEDGVSYLNACVATNAGTSPRSVGTCEGEPIQSLSLWSDNYRGELWGAGNEANLLAYLDEDIEEDNEDDEEDISDNEDEEETAHEEGASDEQDNDGNDEQDDGQDGEQSDEDEDVEENTEGDQTTEDDETVDESDSGSENDNEGGSLLSFVADLFRGSDETEEEERARIVRYIRNLLGLDDKEAQELVDSAIENELVEPEIVTEEEIIEELVGESLIDGETTEEEEELLLEIESAEEESAQNEEEMVEPVDETPIEEQGVFDEELIVEEEIALPPEEEVIIPSEEDINEIIEE